MICYFLDLENIAKKWLDVVRTIRKSLPMKEDILCVLFYTDVVCSVTFAEMHELCRGDIGVEFRHCVRGNNALDFQLCSELGFIIGSNANVSKCIIVSNDTGFDAMIPYWRENHKISVSRMGVSQLSTSSASTTVNHLNGSIPKISSDKKSAYMKALSKKGYSCVVSEVVVNYLLSHKGGTVKAFRDWLTSRLGKADADRMFVSLNEVISEKGR